MRGGSDMVPMSLLGNSGGLPPLSNSLGHGFIWVNLSALDILTIRRTIAATAWIYLTIALMIASFLLLSHALKTIPVGTGYAVWTGIGAAGTAALVGMLFLGESHAPLRLLCLALIITGVLGLKLLSPTLSDS